MDINSKIDILRQTTNLNLFQKKFDEILLIARNLDLSITSEQLQFSSFSTAQKIILLFQYLYSQYSVEVQPLIDEWSAILESIESSKNCTTFQNEDLFEFQTNFSIYLDEIQNILYSFIYFSAVESRFAEKSLFKIEKDSRFSTNVLFLLENISIFESHLYKKFTVDDLTLWKNVFDRKTYEKMFQKTKQSFLFMILYGKNTPEWNQFVNLVTQLKT